MLCCNQSEGHRFRVIGVAAVVVFVLIATLILPMSGEENNSGSAGTAQMSAEEANQPENGSEDLTDADARLLAKPFYSDDGELLCGIRLSADKTQFFVGDEAVVTLELSLTQNILDSLDGGDVTLLDEQGNEIGRFPADSFQEADDGRYVISGTLQLSTQFHHAMWLKAYGGEYYSPELELTVTPHITADQIADCAVIGAECNEVMAEKYADVTAKERAAAAKEWLDRDERILKTALSGDEETVYYVTADCVAGAFFAAERVESDDPADDYSGINDGSTTDFEEEGLLSRLYTIYENSDIEKNNIPLFIATRDSSVSTNPKSLLLIPCPEDMGAGRDEYISSLQQDFRKYGKKTSVKPVEKQSQAAIKEILSKKLNEYGLITLFTHGSVMDLQWNRSFTHNQETIYLLYRSESLKEFPEAMMHANVKEKLQEFAQIAYQSDTQGIDNEEAFYAQWYSEPSFWDLFRYTQTMMMTTEYSDKLYYEIWMTSGYIMSRYQDQLFDNAVVYLASCKGLMDIDFDQWLLNRGCRYVFGFTEYVNTQANVGYHQELLKYMTQKVDEHPNYYRTVQEATNTIEMPEKVENQKLWFTSAGPLSEAASASPPWGYKNNTLYYVGQNDYIFKGHGKLEGRVCWRDVDTEAQPLNTGEDPEPVIGAKVTAYLMSGRKFSPFEGNEVNTDDNGMFEYPECPMGYLVLIAEAPDGKESNPYQIYFVDDTWDGGDLYISRAPSLAIGACINEYQGQVYKIRESVAELEELPVAPAKYDDICSFAFYGNKLYYCCKEKGTIDYHIALYEANPDGTGQRELYAPDEMDLYLNCFAIKDGCLYYREHTWGESANIYHRINLKDGSVTVSDKTPEDVVLALSSCWTAKDGRKFYAEKDPSEYFSKKIVMENQLGETETIVTTENGLRLESVVSDAATGNLIVYYSTHVGSGRDAALYRMNPDTGENDIIDSRKSGGDGLYFNW